MPLILPSSVTSGVPRVMTADSRSVARLLHLHNSIPTCRLAEPLRAKLGRPLLRLEVHVNDAEAIAVAVDPFEVVLCAPEEVPIHRYAVGDCTLELREVSA